MFGGPHNKEIKHLITKEGNDQLNDELNGTHVNKNSSVIKSNSYVVSLHCGCAPQQGQTDSVRQIQVGRMQYQ
jgi:hypothetical protein